LAGKFPSGKLSWKLLPWIEILTFLTLHHIPLAELHQLSYCLCESVVSLKSYAIEYFGWKTSFGEFFINNSQKSKFQLFDLRPNFFPRAAPFELRMTKIG
jgi:hypothetical protein